MKFFVFFMQTSMEYYYVYPDGMEKIIMYLKERYNNIPIFVAENGEIRTAVKFLGIKFSWFRFSWLCRFVS